MKKIGKIISISLAGIIALSAIGGGTVFAINKNKDNHAVDVTSVGYIGMYDYGNAEYYYGVVTNSMKQEVRLTSGEQIEEVLVKKGDEVAVGTPLIKLDSNLLEIAVEEKEIAKKQILMDIKTANADLVKYQNTIPYEPEETTEEPQGELDVKPYIEAKITVNNILDAYKGDGSESSPYTIRCNGDSIIKADIFKEINDNNMYVNLEIETQISDTIYMYYVVELSKALETVTIQDDYTYVVGNVSNDSKGNTKITFNSEAPLAQITTRVSTENIYHEEEIPEIDSEEEIDEEKYTAAELNKLITDTKNKLKELDIQSRQADINIELAKKQLENGTILSTVNGVVESIEDIENYLSTNENPFMVVNGGNGTYITGQISEYALDKLSVGATIETTAYTEKGMFNYSAQVTEISPFPSDEEYSNINASFYPFTAFISEETQLREGDYVEILLNNEEQQKYYIEKSYIREENGNSYVFVANNNGVLEKRYIKTGEVLYDYYVELQSGLSESEYIAFPYGKYVKEGAKVKMPEDEFFEEFVENEIIEDEMVQDEIVQDEIIQDESFEENNSDDSLDNNSLLDGDIEDNSDNSEEQIEEGK